MPLMSHMRANISARWNRLGEVNFCAHTHPAVLVPVQSFLSRRDRSMDDTSNTVVRLASAALLFQQDAVALVRYQRAGTTFLVDPGGGVQHNENLPEALVREVREETVLIVEPKRVVFIEDLATERGDRTLKVWFLCRGAPAHGTIAAPPEAREEGIIDASWYTHAQLDDEIVYPTILKEVPWSSIFGAHVPVHYRGIIDAR